MNKAIYTKDGTLRKNPPPQYVIRGTDTAVPTKHLQKLRLTGITFLLGPQGQSLDENPDYTEWVRARRELESHIAAHRM
ncbi:hypothetical protein [Paenibacillus xylanexedens]|uniref:hypothetical protein n=1 Tax=Paenibacillus xylanexedens TaxID=528191 RepID=UPI0011A72F4B|nr:hypothetical protein [Paenibacillus xylanexedens]